LDFGRCNFITYDGHCFFRLRFGLRPNELLSCNSNNKFFYSFSYRWW
jgi:hypothetical protein